MKFLVSLFLVGIATSDYIELTMAENNTNVPCVLGDKIEVVLVGQPTTGHIWQNFFLEGNAILEDGEPYYIRNHSNPGSPGIYRFPYTANQVGHSKLRLVEGRSWEDTPVAVFYVTFSVSKPSKPE